MESVGPRLSVKQSVIFTIVGLLVFILYLYFFVGFGEIGKVFQQVDPVEYSLYYSLTVVAIVLSLLFYAMVWHDLLKVLSIEIGLKRSFLYCWTANFVDLVLPLETVSGEITRAYLIHNDLKDQFGKTVASLMGHRMISIFTTLSGLIVSSLYLILQYRVQPDVLYMLTFVTLGTAVTIAVLFYLSAKEEAAGKLVNGLIRLAGIVVKDSQRLADTKKKAKRTLSAFHQGVKEFGQNPKRLVKPVFYSYVSWFFHLLIYFLVFYALGFWEATHYFFQMIVVFSITLAVQTIPVGLPVGPTDIIMSNLFVLFFGVENGAISGTATMLIRAITFWFQILVGYLIVQWLGIKHVLDKGLAEKEGVPENRSTQ